MENHDVIVVGAGLAGLTSSLELADAGKDVLLLEKEEVVGGRTSSWDEDGMEVESGFHRYIGYYSAMPAILHKAGLSLNEVFTWEEQVEVRTEQVNKPTMIGLAPIFGPLKMIRSLIGNQHSLTLKDKLSLVSFFVNGFKDHLLHPHNLDKLSVKEYADRHGVSNDAFHYVIIPLSSGIYFLPPDNYSAYVFFGLFTPGIPRFYKLRIGAFLGGMTEIMCQPIADQIKKKGGRVKTKCSVENLAYENGRVIGVELKNGDIVKSEHVILATTLLVAKQIITPSLEEHQWFHKMLNLPTMDAATIQIDLDQPAMDKDITTFGPTTSLASFAEQSRTTFRHAPGRLSIILSPPEKFLDMPGNDVLEIVCRDAEKLGLPIRGHVTDYRIVTHPDEFHTLSPGHNWMRPSQRTPVDGLTLAGDYTMQPYFSTMEGAVVSGQLAAKTVLKR